jgi:hypothetical protein
MDQIIFYVYVNRVIMVINVYEMEHFLQLYFLVRLQLSRFLQVFFFIGHKDSMLKNSFNVICFIYEQSAIIIE